MAREKIFFAVVIRPQLFIFTRKGLIVVAAPSLSIVSLLGASHRALVAHKFPGRSEGYAHPECVDAVRKGEIHRVDVCKGGPRTFVAGQ